MKKRLFTILLTLAMILSLMPTAFAADTTSGKCGENLTWSFDEATGTLTIDGKGEMYDYTLDYENEAAPWYDLADSITSLKIGDGVTSIGSYAFWGTDLQEVDLSQTNITKLGTHAFANATVMTSIKLPKGITEISEGLFFECWKLESIEIPDSVTAIRSGAFSGCSSLKSLTFPASVTLIEHSIAICSDITEVYFTGDAPRMYKNMETLATGEVTFGTFAYFVNTTAYYPANNDTWTAAIFDADWGAEITWVPYEPASTIPTSGKCGDNLTWSYADGKLTISGEGEMYDYSEKTSPWYDFSDEITSLEISEGVTRIGSYAFCSTALGNVDLSQTNVTQIGSFAFLYSSITSIKLPKGLTEIPEAIFWECYSLASVEIPDSVTSIGSDAFGFCWELTSLTIPASVAYLSDGVFAFNEGSIYFTGNAPQLLTAGDPTAEGTAPRGSFHEFVGTIYYPANDETWTDVVLQDYGGEVTWVPYTPATDPEPPVTEPPVQEPEIEFTDVPEGEYYAGPVAWAVAEGITTGTTSTTFSPNAPCTRAQVVTFLWRAADEPEPKSTSTGFTDVPADAYYAKAVAWAVENGITNGMGGGKFGSDQACTRAQVATFLWRAASEPAAASADNPFTDAAPGEFYYEAVLWAVGEGITNGMSETTFAPATTCNRAQIVTFLHRYMTE